MYKHRNGFTLIELLVVIAIIAILAAILFPVFAKVREKARQTTCASNMKQMALGVIQYEQDYDETNPAALPWNPNDGNAWWEFPTWVVVTQPYIKSYAVFQCPDDSAAQTINWVRPGLSYSANAYLKGLTTAGAFNVGGNWNFETAVTLGMIQRPSDTIMIGERHNDDVINSHASGNAGNGNGIQGYPPFTGVNWLDSWFGFGEIPNGTLPAASYPNGPNGSVSAKHTQLANFAFCDGHGKAMFPVQTDPDPNNKPDQNLWDATRQ